MRAWPAVCAATGAVFWSLAAGGQGLPPAGFPGKPPPAPPVEIRHFTVEPAQIKPGSSTTLRWEASNTYSLTIEPDIGVVATRGARELTPSATTTYTLTASGAGGAKVMSVTVTVAGTVPRSAEHVALTEKPIPRLADGKPDLSGLYIVEGGLRPVATQSGASAPRLVSGAESFRVVAKEGDLGQGVTCLPPGVPGIVTQPFPFQIVQKPDVLVIAYEAYQQFRIIPVGVPHAEYLAPAWNGHSVARWDGDTLVVDVQGFNDKSIAAGYRHTEEMTVVERYTRTSFDTIAYETTIADPHVFAEPLRLVGTLKLHPEWEINEYNCTENNQDYDALFEVK